MRATRINAKNRYIAQVREKRRIDKTPAESADSIKDYVDHVADIAIRPDKAGGTPDFDTPLVDNTLPADLDPETAAGMASTLRAALPRIRELLGLLTRRGNRTKTKPRVTRRRASPPRPARRNASKNGTD